MHGECVKTPSVIGYHHICNQSGKFLWHFPSSISYLYQHLSFLYNHQVLIFFIFFKKKRARVRFSMAMWTSILPDFWGLARDSILHNWREVTLSYVRLLHGLWIFVFFSPPIGWPVVFPFLIFFAV